MRLSVGSVQARPDRVRAGADQRRSGRLRLQVRRRCRPGARDLRRPDNDCDGTTDECAGDHNSAAYLACKNDALGDLGAGGGDSCGSNVAPCMPGKTKCVADADGMGHAGFTCVGRTTACAEICNGMDDDCDTKIDEDLDPVNDPRLGQRCDVSASSARAASTSITTTCANDPDDAPCGQCRFGLQECVLGAIDCVGLDRPVDVRALQQQRRRLRRQDRRVRRPERQQLRAGRGRSEHAGRHDVRQHDRRVQAGHEHVRERRAHVQGPRRQPPTRSATTRTTTATTTSTRAWARARRAGRASAMPDRHDGVRARQLGRPGVQRRSGPERRGVRRPGQRLRRQDRRRPRPGEPCGTDEGLCSKGKLECQNGHTVCSGEKGPQLETCDCEDNDCDGKIDETSATEPICPGSAECVMCQCALPCAPTTEFSAQCPQGKAAIEDHGDCFCVGEQCRQLDCQKQTIKVSDDVQCAPDSDLVGTCLCKNNECTFRCAGVTCENNLICDPTDGRCKQRSCLLPQFRCADGKRCQLSDELDRGIMRRRSVRGQEVRVRRSVPRRPVREELRERHLQRGQHLQGRHVRGRPLPRRAVRPRPGLRPEGRQVRQGRRVRRHRVAPTARSAIASRVSATRIRA